MPKKVTAPKKAAKKVAGKKTTLDTHNCHCCSAICGNRK